MVTLRFWHTEQKLMLKVMHKAISSYSNSQGDKRFKLKDSLIRFFNVIQQNFSSSLFCFVTRM